MNSASPREDDLFQAAVRLPGAERAAYLERQCAHDPPLRARLEARLAAADSADASMTGQTESCPTFRSACPESPDEGIGTTLGRYKLLERLGEGGCGVVYVAEQSEPMRRRVALKVLKLGMDTRQVVARFEAERQALALMDHPNIAKVLDAGATAAGRPYFVMELVRGIRITDYCDQHRCSTGERLELFVQVCHAIQHAHQKGIVHRDIKPSNILVSLHDGGPCPKVIDFGIAKAVEGRLVDATIYTQLHQVIGTPAYMSPEQAEMSSLDIDTRSDIYSLGVLLYELLTGSTPFDGEALLASGIDAMRRTIREKEPLRPSTRLGLLSAEELAATAGRQSAAVSELVTLLQGDLDWVVMKCLEKDRRRRYETANGLAMDVVRFSRNEPVTARPPSAVYRFRKAFRRNRILFTAAGCVLTSLILAMVMAGMAARRESIARRQESAQRVAEGLARAEAERQRALADSRLLTALGLVDSLVETNLPHLSSLVGATEATEGLIRAIVRMVEELNQDAIADPQVRVRLANLNVTLGSLRGLVPGSSGLGDPETAMRFTTEAIRMIEHPSVRELPRAAWLPVRLRVWAGMGANLHTLGRFEEALRYFTAALEDATEWAGHSEAGQSLAPYQISRCRTAAGRVLRDMGRHQEALDRYFLPAFAWTRTLQLTDESPSHLLDETRTVCINIADALSWLGRPREALSYAQEGLRLSQTLVKREPNSARTLVLLPASKSQMGKLLLALGEPEQAAPFLEESLATAEQLVARDPNNAGMRLFLCYVLGSHALGYAAWSREEEAPLSERTRRGELARTFLNRAFQQLDAFPSESARILPRHGLNSAAAQVEAAPARLESSGREEGAR